MRKPFIKLSYWEGYVGKYMKNKKKVWQVIVIQIDLMRGDLALDLTES